MGTAAAAVLVRQMSKREVPSNLDWVDERAKCSPIVMFESLRDLARQNTRQRNESLGFDSPKKYWFAFNAANDDHAFAVIDLRGNFHRRATSFRLLGDVIEVEPASGDRFQATLTLTDSGECKLLVDGVDLYPWQVMRRALEALFFAAP